MGGDKESAVTRPNFFAVPYLPEARVSLTHGNSALTHFMTDNDQLRNEEYQVLESIYPDYILEHTPNSIRLEIPIELDTPHRILLAHDGRKPSSSISSATWIETSHLPPVLVDISLKSEYPISTGPIITYLHSTRSWLPKELELIQLLHGLWQGEGVLCTIVETVRSGDFLRDLRLSDDGSIR
jgi:E3 ubiquitin-protein ligase RNF14